MTTAVFNPETIRLLRVKITSAFLVMASAAVLLLSACTPTISNETAPEQLETTSLDPRPLTESTVLKVSSAGNFEFLTALYLADEFGEFAKENIVIEYVSLPSGSAIPALALGQVDVSAVGVTATLFNNIAEGAEVKLVLSGPLSPEGDGLWIRSEVEPSQLPSKLRIGGSQGAGWLGIVPVEKYLKEQNLTLADVVFQQLPIGDLATALDLGAVDAAWLNSPAHEPFLESGKARLVASYSGAVSGTAFAFGPRLLEKEPSVGQAFVRALMRTMSQHLAPGYKGNPETVAAIAQKLGISEELLRGFPELNFGTTYNTDLAIAAQRLWIELGGITSFNSPLPANSFVDNQFFNSISVD
jgi:NitT/TauT family transport system substrate-binding protein